MKTTDAIDWFESLENVRILRLSGKMLMSYIGGSRYAGSETEASDYDMIIVSDGPMTTDGNAIPKLVTDDGVAHVMRVDYSSVSQCLERTNTTRGILSLMQIAENGNGMNIHPGSLTISGGAQSVYDRAMARWVKVLSTTIMPVSRDNSITYIGRYNCLYWVYYYWIARDSILGGHRFTPTAEQRDIMREIKTISKNPATLKFEKRHIDMFQPIFSYYLKDKSLLVPDKVELIVG